MTDFDAIEEVKTAALNSLTDELLRVRITKVVERHGAKMGADAISVTVLATEIIHDNENPKLHFRKPNK